MRVQTYTELLDLLESDLTTFLAYLDNIGLINLNSNCLKCGGKLHLYENEGLMFRCYTYIGGKRCIYSQSVRKNTNFANTKMKIEEILKYFYLYLVQDHSFKIIQHETNISSGSCVDWANLCREVIAFNITRNKEKLGGEGKIVEIDEWKWRKGKGQWVFGGAERDSKKIFMVPVERRNKEILLEIIKERIKPGTKLISNCFKTHDCLNSEGYSHIKVTHSIQFIVPGTDVDTNKTEGVWGWKKFTLPSGGRKKKDFLGYLALHLWRSQRATSSIFEDFLHAAVDLYKQAGP